MTQPVPATDSAEGPAACPDWCTGAYHDQDEPGWCASIEVGTDLSIARVFELDPRTGQREQLQRPRVAVQAEKDPGEPAFVKVRLPNDSGLALTADEAEEWARSLAHMAWVARQIASPSSSGSVR